MPVRQLKERRLARLRGVYAIVDESSARRPLDLVDALLRGGVRVVQLRCKNLPVRDLLAIAHEAVARCRQRDALLIVNDRADVARAVGADGVHVGQEDLPVGAAREVVGEDALVGVSTHSDAEIDAGIAAGADYLGFGPIFQTRSKPGAPLPPPHGLDGLERAVRRAGVLPLVAIGGITAQSASGVARTGAACAAVIAELCHARDPEAAARALLEAFARG
ncbi:MAG TPA: thiamine phosphate synthase [Myxococcales bacterium]|nr:thiamine phosphate synthase [Myxococcales bacterium]